MDKKNIKLAYIGGGSKMWARVFMNDLALNNCLEGEIALYDIDQEAATRNLKIGAWINKSPKTVAKWKYKSYFQLKDALQGADVVVISILPGTFEEMRSDVHAPELYHIYQSVGDTVGPGGILRAMRTVPLYEGFAKAIKDYCPKAWVINLTNPMTICVKTLYDVFPEIKCFGCCHEVFHAQEFLTIVAHEILNIPRPSRKEIYTDVSGINHFTWFSHALYKGQDLLSLIPEFEKSHYEEGYYEEGNDPFAFRTDCFAYGNKVKMNLFNRYGVLAAAGDRHLAEFCPQNWYLKNPSQVQDWRFQLTTVDFRIKQQQERIKETIMMADGEKPVEVTKSNEECVEMIQALMGFDSLITNVNLPNKGQVPYLPLGTIVETNANFTPDSIKPIHADTLPLAVQNLIMRNCLNIETCYQGIKNRDLGEIFNSFINQPLCSNLTEAEGRDLFRLMMQNTRKYLDPFYLDIDKFN
jgi:alpha-galactosidase/6-phospho-beta-glucosidase family protein